MKAVVCFYEKDLLLHSTDYIRMECPSQQDPTLFLKKIESEYSSKMKVIQTSFDYQKASVYILNTFNLIRKDKLVATSTHIDFNFKSNLSRNGFIEKVKQIRTDIQNGRFYQLNLTSFFQADKIDSVDSYEIFKYYFNKFNSEFAAFLPGNESEILCYSPELFLEKKGRTILTRPIKGTNQVGKQFDDLLKDQKENAELSMIVDLLRNDLQSVCVDKVVVTEHRKELKLNYLTHTYSEISGETDQSLPDILRQMLPAGSISGCPKKESVIAIHEIEDFDRQFYTGCIGWWKNQDFKLNVAIRSFLNDPDRLTYFAGCGIVFDSDPEKEWEEFLRKAKHLELKDV